MALKVFDLQCDVGHVFEGWFGSADDYDKQRDQGLLVCPVCDSNQISKMLSAPRLNMGRGKSDGEHTESMQATPEASEASVTLAKLQAQVLSHIREIVRNADNVGDRFAQEARRMHEGEIDHRPIRGSTTPQEREELAREGIAVLPIPDFLDDDRLQ
ncbi:MAG TPA: DUF1178 family protein [Pusillimonas sp.]|uniref:DUF1178 family protein n=1 Tax=unclassified Pusillimonas TaxID=2640016 RepID=UPI002622ECB7|nr:MULTISPECIES: DUF1178 family protein [unclassified Pusillimonas]HLU20173.1 DUF1178 family protein [Pusillimonas sp.]